MDTIYLFGVNAMSKSVNMDETFIRNSQLFAEANSCDNLCEIGSIKE